MKAWLLFWSGLALALPGMTWLLWLVCCCTGDNGIYQEHPYQTAATQLLLLVGMGLLGWATWEKWTEGE